MPKTPSKKIDNRKSIDHDKFCELIVDGVKPSQALIAAGGKDGTSTRHYAQVLKKKYDSRIKEIAIERAGEGMLGLIRLSPKAINVLEETMACPETKQIDKARLAKDILGSVQDLLPKQTVHEHKHTHEVSNDEAENAARILLEKFRGSVGGGSPKVVDGDFEEQSRTSAHTPEGGEEE